MGLHLRWWLVCKCSWLPFNVCSLENQNYFICLLWHIPAASRYLTFSGSCCCSLRCCQQYWGMARAKLRTLFHLQVFPPPPSQISPLHTLLTPIYTHQGPRLWLLSYWFLECKQQRDFCCLMRFAASLSSMRTLQIMSLFDFQLPLTTDILNAGKSSWNFLFCTSGSQNSHWLATSTCKLVHL